VVVVVAANRKEGTCIVFVRAPCHRWWSAVVVLVVVVVVVVTAKTLDRCCSTVDTAFGSSDKTSFSRRHSG